MDFSISFKQLASQLNSIIRLSQYKDRTPKKILIQDFYVDSQKLEIINGEYKTNISKTQFSLLNMLFKSKNSIVPIEKILKKIKTDNKILNYSDLEKEITTLSEKFPETDGSNIKIEIIENEGCILSVNDSHNTLNTFPEKSIRRKLELRAIINTINQGLIAFNKDHEIRLINKEFKRLYKIDSNKIQKKQIFNIDPAVEEIYNLLEEPNNNRVSLTNTHSDNRTFRYKGIKILNKSTTQNIGYLILIEDITDIVELEGMRRNFVSNVTHELKTPLTSIIGYTETLQSLEKPDSVTLDKFLSIIRVESERLLVLINDILTLSEIEEIQNLMLYEVNITNILDTITNSFLDSTKKEIKLLKQYDSSKDLYVKATDDYIYQLIQNIISNAYKYTESGTITVSLDEIEDGGIQFTVTDTGHGIPKSSLSHIFERFYRVDKARDRASGGTGLGLSIVKHICEYLDAGISISSEVGVGTTIKILFKPTN